jgi:hypothetical protein
MPRVLDRPAETDMSSTAPLADAPAGGAATPVSTRRPAAPGRIQVRAADLEPYVGLKYLSRLFKLMAVILILLLVSEVIVQLVDTGLGSLPDLLPEVSRLIVLAGLLWGAGDLAILFIDMGHDVRATRILIGRQLAHQTDDEHTHVDPGIVVEPQTEEPAAPV